MNTLMHITKKEREIIALIASGYKYPEIAAELYLSKHTVKRHMQKVYDKTMAGTLAQATALAVAHGLIVYDGIAGFKPVED